MPRPKLTPSQRHQRAKIASNARWAKTADREKRLAVTQAGRDAAEARFIDIVDPERKLSEAERAKAVRNAKTAYFTGLAFRRSRNRQAQALDGEAS